jgi:hypothetical protein
VRIGGALDTDRVRSVAVQTVDELFYLMKPPSTDEKLPCAARMAACAI